MARPTDEKEALEKLGELWVPPAWRTYILTQAKDNNTRPMKLVRQLLKQVLPDDLKDTAKGDPACSTPT